MSVFPGPPWRPWEYGHGRLPAEIKFPIILQTMNASPPGSFEAAQYGMASSGPETKNMATFPSIQTTPGDLIRVEWMSYIDPSPGAAEFFVSHGLWPVNDGGENAPNFDQVVDFCMDCQAAGEWWYHDGTWNAFSSPTLNVVYNEWVPVTLEYAVGGTQFTLTYDGNTATGNAKNLGSNNGFVGQFQVGHGRGSINYIDAVPEPSTCAMALIGLLTVVGCYRRRRSR